MFSGFRHCCLFTKLYSHHKPPYPYISKRCVLGKIYSDALRRFKLYMKGISAFAFHITGSKIYRIRAFLSLVNKYFSCNTVSVINIKRRTLYQEMNRTFRGLQLRQRLHSLPRLPQDPILRLHFSADVLAEDAAVLLTLPQYSHFPRQYLLTLRRCLPQTQRYLRFRQRFQR